LYDARLGGRLRADLHGRRRKGNPMPEREHIPSGVVRVIELVGSSPVSFSDAVRMAVKTASGTIRNIRGVEVVGSNADVDEHGNLSVYKVDVKIAFVYDMSHGGPV
jgi:flavin-binding protein dodecin